MPPARPTGNHYRHFTVGVLAVAAIVAVASDGSTGGAPAAVNRPAKSETALPATASLAARPGASGWDSGGEEIATGPDIATLPDSEEDAAEARPAAPPKAGRRGPADRPTPAQLAMLITVSRERSGAPADGD